MNNRAPARKFNKGGDTEWSNLPSDDSVPFTHVTKIFYKFPHARIADFDLINVDCKEGEACSAE